MGLFHRVGFRLQPLFLKRRIEEDLSEEIRSHLEMMAEANARAGMSPEEALCAARREFGGVDQVKERFRDERSFVWVEQLRMDVRFACRSLLKSPGFTAVALLTLAFGIGAGAAVLSVVDAALLRPLAYTDPGQLVQIRSVSPEGTRFPAAIGPAFKEWCDRATVFDALAIVHPWNLNLIGGGSAELIGGAEVSTGVMRVFGLEPALGRGFGPGDDRAGNGNPVVMLTYEWWQSRFAGDPSIVGRKINLSQIPRTVVGVLPPRALPDDKISFLVPLALDGDTWRASTDNLWAPVVARLGSGVSIDAASREIAEITRRFYARLPRSAVAYGTELVPMQAHLAAKSRPALLMLLGAVAVLLAIVCVNLANLLLARASARGKEMAVRVALGAGAGRIARQMFTETFLLALLGGLLGFGVAAMGIGVLNRMAEGVIPAIMRSAIDLRAACLCLLMASIAGIFIGMLQVLLASKSGVSRALKEVGGGFTSGTRSATQSMLVVSEVALTLMLLIDGGLLLRSYFNILSADPGYDPHHTVACDVSLTVSRFDSWMSVVRFENEIGARLRRIPGMEAVGTSGGLPLRGTKEGPEGLVHGEVRAALATRDGGRDEVEAGLDLVAGDYFSAMGIRVLQGRVLTDSDNRLNAPPVVVINDQLARLLMPGRNPIGQTLRCGDGIGGEIVGVVGGVRDGGLDAPPAPRVYGPQVINPWDCSVVMRTALAPSGLEDRVRTTIAAILPDQSVTNFRTLDEDVSRSLQERRMTLALVGVFAAVALCLACIGIYGVGAYAAHQRERELCVRMALGAQHRDIVRLILGDGLRAGLAGIIAGLAGGAIGAQLVAGRLYGVSAHDPAVFVSVTALVALAAAAFVYLPARRVARLEPASVLRSE